MIVLVRHGETFWSREGRIQGHTESDLTHLGVRQAHAMADMLALEIPQDAVFRLQNGQIDRFDCEPLD